MLEGDEGLGEEGGGAPTDHVYVGGHDVGGMEEAENAGDHCAPVAALGDFIDGSWSVVGGKERRQWRECSVEEGLGTGECTVFIVAEPQHQFMTCFCILRQSEAFLVCAGGESVIREGGGDHMKGRTVFTAAASKGGEDLCYFEKTAGP